MYINYIYYVLRPDSGLHNIIQNSLSICTKQRSRGLDYITATFAPSNHKFTSIT